MNTNTQRYEVVADYPSSTYKIGDILHSDTENMSAFFGKYPHLFRPLKWWEHVPIDELPKYVKWVAGDRIHVAKIDHYELNSLLGNVYAKTSNNESLLLGEQDHPSTEAEYQEYITKLNAR
jgi:hypothetical protein